MDWQSSRIFICGTTRNCESHIDSVFSNIDRFAQLFADFRIIISFDHSIDRTLLKLAQQKHKYSEKLDILINTEPVSHIRTQNISNARNKCLEKMRQCL